MSEESQNYLKIIIIYKNLWTRLPSFNASVPKIVKKGLRQAGTNQSELSRRDESIRKTGFCTETDSHSDARQVNTEEGTASC